MKFSNLLNGVLLFVLATFSYAALGQSQGTPSNGEPSVYSSQPQGTGKELSADQLKLLGDYLDKANALNRNEIKNKPSKEVATQRASEIITVLNLPCSITDAELVGTSSGKVHGKTYQTNTYEIACTNNTGYFVSAKTQYKENTGKLYPPVTADSHAITCFSAEGLRANDEAKGVKSDFYCQLPENGGGDIKVMGEKLLATANVTCKVSKLIWFGIKLSDNTEYTEAACDNGTGYLLQTALPGGTIKPTAMTCVEASSKGLDCKMTPVIKPPTLETFKSYLEHTNINCKIENYDQIKVLGKESLKQRYVVEFKCPQQPNGLVAFIPLEGNINKFETADCTEVKKHGVSCKLNIKN